MTAVVDFLPASYRAMLHKRRERLRRIVLAIPILAALLATDLLLRARIHGLGAMVRLAGEHADMSGRRGLEAEALQQRVANLRIQIERDSAHLTATRIPELLATLLATKPPGVHFRSLQCRFDPWTTQAPPDLQIDASCTDLDDLGSYLSALRNSKVLPPLECSRANAQEQDGRQAFHLESRHAAPPVVR